VFAVRDRNSKSDFQIVIERAITIACDLLIPRGLDASWRDLTLVERYYLRALDIESRGERRKGMYEELARGFGVTDIRPLLNSDKANGTRLHTPTGFAASHLAQAGGGHSDVLPSRRGRAAAGASHPFATSPLRHLLFAIRETTAADNSPELKVRAGITVCRNYLIRSIPINSHAYRDGRSCACRFGHIKNANKCQRSEFARLDVEFRYPQQIRPDYYHIAGADIGIRRVVDRITFLYINSFHISRLLLIAFVAY